MLFLISPAKALDETPAPQDIAMTDAAFIPQAQALIEELKLLGPVDIAQLMKLSDKLAELNYDRFQAWQFPFDPAVAKQAVLLFKGDVYQGLQAGEMDAAQLDYLQNHLRILSGLYGLLKPLDGMLPYRLEMGTKSANAKGKDLYAFWVQLRTSEHRSMYSYVRLSIDRCTATYVLHRSCTLVRLSIDRCTATYV